MPIGELISTASWGVRKQTLGEFVLQTRAFLSDLQQLDPLFRNMYLLGNRENAEKKLDPDFENLEDLALEHAWDKKAPKSWFENLLPGGAPALDSTLNIGWRWSFVNEPERAKTSKYVHISIRAGAYSKVISNNRVLVTAQGASSPLTSLSLSEKIFRLMITSWEPERCYCNGPSFRDATLGGDLVEQLGWLNYRSDPGFARFLPGEIQRESYGEGIIFRIGDGRVLTEEDYEEVRQGRAIQAALQASRE